MMTNVIRKTMRAVALDQVGRVEQLKLQTPPVPEVGPGEVLIRMEAAGVGVWDPFEREGGFARISGLAPKFPYGPGDACAGRTRIAAAQKPGIVPIPGTCELESLEENSALAT